MTIPRYDGVEHFYKMKKLDEGSQVIRNNVDCANSPMEDRVIMAASILGGAAVGSLAGGAGAGFGAIIGAGIGITIIILKNTKCCDPVQKAKILKEKSQKNN